MSAPEPPPVKRLDIRKYPNRRYYDATHSRHLTLEEIRSLIHEGYDIKVTDSKSGVDITAQVLTQIILELETPKIDTFPIALLLRMIRSNDQVVRDFVEKYFNQAFNTYLEYQKQMEERLRQMQGMPGFFPPFGAWGQAGLAPLAPFLSSSPQPGSHETANATEKGQTNEARDLQASIADMKKQLADLQQEMRSKKTKPRSKRAPK